MKQVSLMENSTAHWELALNLQICNVNLLDKVGVCSIFLMCTFVFFIKHLKQSVSCRKYFGKLCSGNLSTLSASYLISIGKGEHFFNNFSKPFQMVGMSLYNEFHIWRKYEVNSFYWGIDWISHPTHPCLAWLWMK